jgi:hypothetical protein
MAVTKTGGDTPAEPRAVANAAALRSAAVTADNTSTCRDR